MYFINDSHEKNFNHLTQMVFRASNDVEYQVLSYVLALPEVYNRCIEDPLLHESPYAWIYDYKDVSYTEKDGDELIEVFDIEYKTDKKGVPVYSDAYSVLPTSYKIILDVGINLFNNREQDFTVMDGLGTWDDKLFKVFLQLILIRKSTRNMPGVKITLH